MTTAGYLLILAALVVANLSFCTPRFLWISPWQKTPWLYVLEIFLGFVLIGGLGYGLEARSGGLHPQNWEFYAVVFCLYLVLGYPGFVLRFLWKPPKRSVNHE